MLCRRREESTGHPRAGDTGRWHRSSPEATVAISPDKGGMVTATTLAEPRSLPAVARGDQTRRGDVKPRLERRQQPFSMRRPARGRRRVCALTTGGCCRADRDRRVLAGLKITRRRLQVLRETEQPLSLLMAEGGQQALAGRVGVSSERCSGLFVWGHRPQQQVPGVRGHLLAEPGGRGSAPPQRQRRCQGKRQERKRS